MYVLNDQSSKAIRTNCNNSYPVIRHFNRKLPVGKYVIKFVFLPLLLNCLSQLAPEPLSIWL